MYISHFYKIVTEDKFEKYWSNNGSEKFRRIRKVKFTNDTKEDDEVYRFFFNLKV